MSSTASTGRIDGERQIERGGTLLEMDPAIRITLRAGSIVSIKARASWVLPTPGGPAINTLRPAARCC